MRAAYIKYANNSELPTLADKLDFMIKTKLVPNAGKAKAKTLEDEKQFKIGEQVIDEYAQLQTVFEYFGSNKSHNPL